MNILSNFNNFELACLLFLTAYFGHLGFIMIELAQKIWINAKKATEDEGALKTDGRD